MENLPEDIDAVLDPVIGKQTIKRGRNLILKIGDAEVEYDQNFRSDLNLFKPQRTSLVLSQSYPENGMKIVKASKFR